MTTCLACGDEFMPRPHIPTEEQLLCDECEESRRDTIMAERES